MTDPLPTVSIEDDPLIGLSVGAYRIESFLAGGGMGLVYCARHERIDRRFAIKVLRPEAAADAVLARNFIAEAQTLSELKHPNIIDIVGFGLLPDGRNYMVTEFLEGVTLEDEMREGRLSLERVLSVADQILAALNAAHSVEVIHRDLKPANVFLARGSGGVETVKLLDFGLARHQPISISGLVPGVSSSRCTVIAGTPEYIAPEQAMGGAPNKASDLYSFGVMLFEMACGRLPFLLGETDERVEALLRMHTSQEAPSPEEVGAELPLEVSSLLEELLSKPPAARPPSALAVKERLHAARLAPIPLVKFRSPHRRRSTRGARLRAAGGGLVALGVALLVARSSLASTAPIASVAEPVSPAVAIVPESPPPLELATPPVVEVPPAEVPPEPPPVVRVLSAPTPKSQCQPDARWRAAAQVNLQELQQLAAQKGHWADFERLEPKLSNAIDAAKTADACEAADQQIRKLALGWRK